MAGGSTCACIQLAQELHGESEPSAGAHLSRRCRQGLCMLLLEWQARALLVSHTKSLGQACCRGSCTDRFTHSVTILARRLYAI